MKNLNRFLFLMLTMTLFLFSLTGCFEKREDVPRPLDEDEQSEVVENQNDVSEETTFNQETFMQEILPTIDYLHSCDEEIYAAEVDFETCLNGAFVEENGNYKLVALYGQNDELPADCIEDPAAASYYPVLNFESIDQIREYAKKYMMDDQIPSYEVLQNNFVEFDNQVYLCRGGRGYGNLLGDIDTLEYVREENDMQIVKMDYFMFDEYEKTVLIYFANENNTWKIAKIIEE